MSENTVILDGQQVTVEQLQEKRNSLKNGERIVEVSSNTYETVVRMNG